MFAPDIVSLRQFYATPLGESAQSLIAEGIERLWPDARGDTILGVGYATPYLESYIDKAALTMVCMPAHQGAVAWPKPTSPQPLRAEGAELVGAWGISLRWNDGHSTGIYAWDVLRAWSED
jgi:hypothetical protein